MACTSDLPRILIATSFGSDIPSDEVLKGFLGDNPLPEPDRPLKNILEYGWRISNKYYSADVRIRCVGEVPFADYYLTPHAEGLLVTFNPNEAKSWTSAQKWHEYAEERSLEVRLLVCRSLESSALSREDVLGWCIDHEFELVELETSEDTQEDEEEGFRVGRVDLARCVEALNAHTWSNLQLKNQSKPSQNDVYEPSEDLLDSARESNGTSESRETITEGACAGATSNGSNRGTGNSSLETLEKLHEEKNQKGSKTDASSLLPEADSSVLGSLASDEGGEESFEQLFDRFRSMKDRAENMPHEQRKAYAEQVVMAFWTALGGDAGEMAGLDLNDDEPTDN